MRSSNIGRIIHGVKWFIGVGGLSLLVWLIMAKTPISLPGPIIIDPPGAYLERARPDSTPTGVVGIWFAEISGDQDWSRRNTLMDAVRLEMTDMGSDKVDLKEYQSVVRTHKDARAVAARVNAAIVVWGRLGKIGDEETLSVFHTVIPRVDGFEPEQGPVVVTVSPKGKQVRPENAARQLRREAKIVAAYTAVVQNNFSRARELYESLLSDFSNTKSERLNFHFFAGFSQQEMWETDKKKSIFLSRPKIIMTMLQRTAEITNLGHFAPIQE